MSPLSLSLPLPPPVSLPLSLSLSLALSLYLSLSCTLSLSPVTMLVSTYVLVKKTISHKPIVVNYNICFRRHNQTEEYAHTQVMNWCKRLLSMCICRCVRRHLSYREKPACVLYGRVPNPLLCFCVFPIMARQLIGCLIALQLIKILLRYTQDIGSLLQKRGQSENIPKGFVP